MPDQPYGRLTYVDEEDRPVGNLTPVDDDRPVGKLTLVDEDKPVGRLTAEKQPRRAPTFMELQQGLGLLPAVGLKAVQGAATVIDKVFGDTEEEKEQQRRDPSGAMIEESTPANLAIGLAGAKGLSMLTKTPFVPAREAIESVTQIPMPWKGKKAAPHVASQINAYHGSGREIVEFSKDVPQTTLGGLAKHGYFFGDKETASRYARDFFPESPTITGVRLDYKKPLTLSAIDFEKLQSAVSKIDSGEALSESSDIGLEMLLDKAGIKYTTGQHPVDLIKNNGFDAIIKQAGKGGAESEMMVFNKNQIQTQAQLRAGNTQKVPPRTVAANMVDSMYDASEKEVEALHKTKLKDILRGAKARIADVSGNVKDDLKKTGGIGEDAAMRHDLARGASSITDMELEKYRGAIYEGLSHEDEKQLNRIIASRRTATIGEYKDVANTMGLTPEDHKAYLAGLAEADPQRFKVLNERADQYFGVMKEQLGKMRKEGLIDDEAYEALVSKGDYSPRKFIQYIDPEQNYTFGGTQMTVSSSGIKALREGSERAMENNSRLLMAETVARTNARIMKNRANQELVRLAQELPDNGIVKLVGDDVPAGFEKISAMVDGKKVNLAMPSDLAKEWVLSDPQISKQLSSTIGWLSGSKILKPMATGLNPEFAVTNFARDLAHIFLTTDEYSSFMPKAMAQQAVDLAATAKDALMRKGDYLKYVQQGGGMEFLTHQGRPGTTGKAIDKLYNVMGYLGETTEIWSRLALRKRALKNAVKQGIDPARAEMRATHAARNYLDFSQGGSFIKAADTAIPYLNAATQGTRGIFRYASDHPGKFTYKVGQIGTLAMGLYYANKTSNPEAWEQVPDREKAGNFIITTPLYYHDKNGDKRYYYFKIAKDQSQRIFASLFENIAAASMGDTFKTNQLAMAFKDALPIVPTGTLPPTIEAMLGYASNKNFWRNEDIWRGRKGIDPSQEYNRYTPEAYVKVGEATGLSPERTKYALEQVFTQGNVWTSLTGGALSAMLGELPKDMRDQTMEEMIGKAPFIRKAMRATEPFAPFQGESEDIKQKRGTDRAVVRREFDTIADDYANGRITKEEAVDFIRTQPREQRRYFLRQLNEKKSLSNIPDGRWWRDLKYQDSGTRAEMYHKRYERANDEEKARLDAQLRKIKGMRSKEFNSELRRLRSED